jgi:hypothetical protein
MSVRVISEVLDKSIHAASELLMLVVLADYSDDQGNSYPGVASLARKCRMSSRNTNYILNALQASGELKVLKNQGPKGTNRYRIMLANLGTHHPLKPTSPLKRTSPLKPTSPTPEAGFPKPLKPTSPEPSLNRQEPSCSKSAPDGFDEFYKVYPRKVGRAAATKAFKAVKANGVLSNILTDIQRRLTDGEWTATAEKIRFIPYPATYLNGRRWEDEPIGPAAATSAWEGAR